MPNALIKSYAEKTGKSVDTVEGYWEEAKESAKEKFGKVSPKFYAYANAIVQKRLGIHEAVSFKQFLMLHEALGTTTKIVRVKIEKGLSQKEALEKFPWKKSYGDVRGCSYDPKTGIQSWI